MRKRRYVKLTAWVLCAMMMALQATTGLAALARPGESVLKDQPAANTVSGIGQNKTETTTETEEAPATSGNTVGGIGKKKNNTVSGLGQKKEAPAGTSSETETSGSIDTGASESIYPYQREDGSWCVDAVNLNTVGYSAKEWYETEELREKCVLLALADCQSIATEDVKQIVTKALEEDGIYLCSLPSDPEAVYMILVTTSGTIGFIYLKDVTAICIVSPQTFALEAVKAYNIQSLVDRGNITGYHKVSGANVAALMAQVLGSMNQ